MDTKIIVTKTANGKIKALNQVSLKKIRKKEIVVSKKVPADNETFAKSINDGYIPLFLERSTANSIDLNGVHVTSLLNTIDTLLKLETIQEDKRDVPAYKAIVAPLMKKGIHGREETGRTLIVHDLHQVNKINNKEDRNDLAIALKARNKNQIVATNVNLLAKIDDIKNKALFEFINQIAESGKEAKRNLG